MYSMGDFSVLSSQAFSVNGAHFADVDSLVKTFENDVVNAFGDISILVKGSRSSKMERVVKAIEASSFARSNTNEEHDKC